MKLLIDDANIEHIKKICEFYPIDGITCNPTLLKKNGKNPYLTLNEIKEYVGENIQLHVQVISTGADAMIQEAHVIQSKLGKNTFIKIPVTPEGLKAIKILHNEGARLTGTAIYNQMQGYLAAKAGANYVAPYVNRIDNMGYDGVQVCHDIQVMIKASKLNCEVLAASFRNSQQVVSLCKLGIDACTVSKEGIEGLIKMDAIELAVDSFKSDFESLCGVGRTMMNVD